MQTSGNGDPDLDVLGKLQSWYSSQCDGGWEHQYGISIETLDNPGWSFRVELTDTYLVGRPFEQVLLDSPDDKDWDTYETSDSKDWYRCEVKGELFQAYCGPHRLHDVISIFLRWANQAPVENKSA